MWFVEYEVQLLFREALQWEVYKVMGMRSIRRDIKLSSLSQAFNQRISFGHQDLIAISEATLYVFLRRND